MDELNWTMPGYSTKIRIHRSDKLSQDRQQEQITNALILAGPYWKAKCTIVQANNTCKLFSTHSVWENKMFEYFLCKPTGR